MILLPGGVEGGVHTSKTRACTDTTNSNDEVLVTDACRRHAVAFGTRDFGTSRQQLKREAIRLIRVLEGALAPVSGDARSKLASGEASPQDRFVAFTWRRSEREGEDN
jgi:hypothetical protein